MTTDRDLELFVEAFDVLSRAYRHARDDRRRLLAAVHDYAVRSQGHAPFAAGLFALLDEHEGKT